MARLDTAASAIACRSRGDLRRSGGNSEEAHRGVSRRVNRESLMSNRSSVLRHAWTVGVVLALAMVPAVAAHGAPSPDARRVTATADVWSSVSVASDRAGVAS